jgi:2-polyprenyl-6-methoxyphenol hydroxylase-like FAD-dependent oxidoreductase
MMSAERSVAIIGAGIGGLCLAQYLRGADLKVTVYERDVFAGSRWDGFRLHINPSGARSLRACLPEQQWHAFLAGSGPGGAFSFLTDKLRPLVTVEESIMYPDAEHDHYAVDRRALRTTLLTGLDCIHFGKEFIGYELTTDGRVTAVFADGDRVTSDVLVGADGAGSRVRRQYLPELEPTNVGVGAVAHKLYFDEPNRTWVPLSLQRGMTTVLSDMPAFLFTAVYEPRTSSRGYVEPGKPAASDNNQDQAGRPYLLAALVADESLLPDDLEELDSNDLAGHVDRLTAGWHPDLRRTLAWSDFDSRRGIWFRSATCLPRWPSSVVTLLGDAIHTMPPIGGLGGNTAIRDAHLLGRTLYAPSSSVSPAIASYETEMRNYSAQALRSATGMRTQGLRHGLSHAMSLAWLQLCARSPQLRRQTFRHTWHGPAAPRPWEASSRGLD